MMIVGCYCLKPGCRRGRPLCRRTDNPRNFTCYCSNYHYPHRLGSGQCSANPRAVERMNALCYGTHALSAPHETEAA